MVSPALPQAPYTPDTIQMDLSPRALAVLNAVTREALAGMMPDEERSETASEAITDEMNAAMMRYMPLRAMLSFGPTTNEQLHQLLAALNQNK